MNDIIKKARTKYDILFTVVILLIGILSCVLSTSGSITLMGVMFILAAIVCWFILKSGFIDTTTSQTLSKSEVFYAVEHKNGILDAVLNNPANLDKYPRCTMNTIKIDIYYNDNDAYMQMYEYIPCDYKPCTKLIKHKMCDVSKLLH